MVIDGYLWLSMVIDGYRWLPMVIYGYRWLPMVVYRWLSVCYLWFIDSPYVENTLITKLMLFCIVIKVAGSQLDLQLKDLGLGLQVLLIAKV